MTDRPTEAARVARANEQSAALSALEVDGFPTDDGALRALNGVYARGAADFENYRPAWSKRDSDGDGFLFFHGADGWVFSDKPPGEKHHYLAAAVPVLDDGAIPIDEKSTTWKISSGREVAIKIVGHTGMGVQDVLLVRTGRAEAALVQSPPVPAETLGPDGSIDARHASVSLQPERKDAEWVQREQSATRLQAAWRGAAVRKQQIATRRDAAAAAASDAEAADRDNVTHSADNDDEHQADDLVKYKFALRLQSCMRGHCLRRRRRWQAEDLESTAPLRAFLGKIGLARLANYFIERGVQWEQFLTLTTKRLGGHMFPHVDFKFTSPEAAAQFRWKPDNTTGRVPWGLPVDERNRLGKALRAERAKIAGREKATQDREDAALKAAEAAALRKVREAEIAEGRIRAEKKLAHERQETLRLLQWKQREKAAAEKKDEERKRKIMQLQGGIAAQELQRRNAENARRKAAQEKKAAQQAVEREEARQKTQRKVAISSLRVDALVRVLPQPQLSQSLAKVGRTGRVSLRPVSAEATPGAGVDDTVAAATGATAFGLEKLRYADKYGTVEELDPSDDTVLLKMPQMAGAGGGTGAASASARTAAVWFPIECLDTAASERYAAERSAAISRAEQAAPQPRGLRQGGVASGVSPAGESVIGALQLPPLARPDQKSPRFGGLIGDSVNRGTATRHDRVPSRRRRRRINAASGAREAGCIYQVDREIGREQDLQPTVGRTPRLESTKHLRTSTPRGQNSRRAARAVKGGGSTFTLQGSAVSRERIYVASAKAAMAPRRLPALQLAL